jgi:replication factor A1
MKISELRPGMSGISVQAKIIDISEPREVQTRYGRRTVADALLEDDSGQISLSLWGDQIRSVEVGNRVNVSGAYVTEFRDKLQLNVPRSGKLEVIKEV